MLYANANGTRRQPEISGERGSCPSCHGDVIARVGCLVMPHWAHVVDAACGSEPETDWHREWKALVPQDRCEVPIGDHRADIVLLDGTVVELQHSPLSLHEIEEREEAYERLLWIFDARSCADNIDLRSKDGGTYRSFRWRWPRKHVAYTTAPTFLDLGDVVLRLGKLYRPWEDGWGATGGWGHAFSTDHMKDHIRRR
jgi:Competence protein CoiA-like family